MSMSIQFELSDKDLEYFENVLDKAKTTAAIEDESVILGKAEKLLNEVEDESKFAPFIVECFQKLDRLIHMLEDTDWKLPETEREQVVNVLAYFVDDYDLIPDDIPGIGYLDDAIMINLAVDKIAKEFKHYAQFEHYRDLEQNVRHNGHVDREAWEEHNRVAMYQRMRNRRSRARSV